MKRKKTYKIYGYDDSDNLVFVTTQPTERKACLLIERLELSGDY